MTYASVVAELFERFPKLQSTWQTQFSSTQDTQSMPYIVFGSVLLPALEEALSTRNLGRILPICAFLEDAAEAAGEDPDLRQLLRVEVGEWLAGAADELALWPWLGEETKRVCEYVPGLATQRRALREERKRRSLGARFRAFVRQFRGG